MLAAAISMTAMAVLGREASRELSTTAIMFYRSALSVPLMLVLALATAGGPSQLATSRPLLHLVRHSIHFLAQYGWFFAISVAPLAQVFAIEFTMPLWITLFAPLLIGERLTLPRLAAAVIGFVGILIVVRPGAETLNAGTLWALTAAAFFALSVIAVRVMTRTETPLRILFWMTVVQTLLALLVSLGDIPLPSLPTFGWLVLIALAGLAGQYCMAKAFALADTLIVMPVDFLRLPLIAAVGMLVYGETLDPWVLGGGALILAGNYWNLMAERRARA